MSLTARGKITLASIQLTTDPATYEAHVWPKRFSKHPGIGGSVTIQDFGHYAKDLVLRLSSGNQFLTYATVQAISAAHRTKGATYTLTDWLGNEFTVFISSFNPKVTFIDDLHTYEMELHVTAITKLFGASYSGG
jgi:hypothetical protein